MDDTRWTSFDLIFFDCDSTLSSIEGIDELARFKGKEWRVGVLTEKAMNGDLDLSEVYGKRLQAIRPTRGELKAIEERYWETLVPDAEAVITALRLLGKQIFIVSGGLAEPVRGFGKRLGVPAENIRAVELEYNELSGDWWRYYQPATQHRQTYLDYDEGPLTVSSGKPAIIHALAEGKHGRRLMIGDGASDLATQPIVDLFVGFGGVVTREKVVSGAGAFIYEISLAPILPIAAGPSARARLAGTPYQSIFDRGLDLVRSARLTFKNPDMDLAFKKAFAIE
ncbi:MAG: HAD-IB family phosphatase [Anaerolineae bacterium]|nr:HAD-IB family phosphatase [Anaerolineae bacterium]